ncbi:IS3 family transposase [Streptomyces sp. NPDC057681]|uniref:IS3 family transposase n=1 Tax=Streptomyces sp. NPDC057681 TaxID=3346209 RepID=UPI0036ADE111
MTPWRTRSPCCISPPAVPTGCRGRHAGLRRLGHRINRKRIERVMRECGISGVTRRRRKGLTRPAKRAVPAPDLVGRDFTASAPGMKLVGDITYIPTGEGWLYLATWPLGRSSGTRWPTTTAHPWS